MMGHREKLKSGDEYDAFSRRSRRALCVFHRPGVAKKTKKRFNRRVRKDAKQHIPEGQEV